MRTILGVLVLIAISSSLTFTAFASVSPNYQYIIEGSGFAVTEDTIKTSQIDLGVFTQTRSGSTTNFTVENGFITLDNEEFLTNNLDGSFLREGKFLRVSGNLDDSNDASVSLFGRLIEESKDASVYGFTGRITTDDTSYKIVYTAKLSDYFYTQPTTTETTENEPLTIRIVEGASDPGLSGSYVDRAGTTRLSYFSQDRITVEPGTTITIINDDLVSHKIISGKENYNDRNNPFTPDGRIDTGTIQPGESTTITFDDMGFYRLYDPDYTWMDITGYIFPDTGSETIRTS